MSNATLRPAGPADWTSIASLLSENALPLDGALDHLSTYVVAEAAGAIVGVAGVEVHDSAGLLRSVAVAESQRRRGLAGALVQRIIAIAEGQGITSLFLLTTSAADYFASLGFEAMDRSGAPLALAASKEFRGACPSSAIFMSRSLATSVPATGRPSS